VAAKVKPVATTFNSPVNICSAVGPRGHEFKSSWICSRVSFPNSIFACRSDFVASNFCFSSCFFLVGLGIGEFAMIWVFGFSFSFTFCGRSFDARKFAGFLTGVVGL
jgi:hypothetical protein